MDIVQDEPQKTETSVEVLPKLLHWLQHNTEFLTEEETKMVCDHLQKRSDFGKEKYGTRLHTFNGRDCELDAQQEIVDCIQYMFQLRLENKPLAIKTTTLFQTLFMIMDGILENKIPS